MFHGECMRLSGLQSSEQIQCDGLHYYAIVPDNDSVKILWYFCADFFPVKIYGNINMNFEATTLKDIAQALGLSTSTVSRALRDSYEISEETKKRVMEYAKKNNYHPNPAALGLRAKRTKSIGVIVSAIANTFFSEAINGMESIAFDKGYNVVITQTQESYEREMVNLQYLYSRSVDGLLASLSSETIDVQHYIEIHQKGLPIVFFDRVADEIESFKVIANNFQGAYDATQHLIDSGFKRIALLANAEQLSITIKRLEGYKKAMEDNGLKITPSYIQYCPHGGLIEVEMKVALAKLFALKHKPDAILAAGGKLTTGCLRLLKSNNIRVPEDIAVVGFSNSELADLLLPSLTVVKQPAFEMGRLATETLIRLIETKREITHFERMILPTEMIIGESSRRMQPKGKKNNCGDIE